MYKSRYDFDSALSSSALVVAESPVASRYKPSSENRRAVDESLGASCVHQYNRMARDMYLYAQAMQKGDAILRLICFISYPDAMLYGHHFPLEVLCAPVARSDFETLRWTLVCA